MRKTTINKLINHLKNVLSDNISMNAYAKKSGLPNNYFWTKKKNIQEDLDNNTISPEDFEVIMDLYEQIKNRSLNPKNKIKYADEKTDDRSEVIINRDDEGKILNYQFQIFVRDSPSIIGTLTRDEMNAIYRMYSNYGSGITQREVSRFFPDYSLTDFKRILRAFNITKASAPFAPHVFEEYDKEDLLKMQFREKENDFLRTYEAEKIKFTESQLKKYMKENQDLKDQIGNISDLVKDLDFSELPVVPTFNNNNEYSTLIIWLSDMHIGAYVSDYSIYNNSYDEQEVIRRMEKILERVSRLQDKFNNIIICNLGDSLDGYNAQTTRGGHNLPQNMNNKEQFKSFLNVMTYFARGLHDLFNVPMEYYCVGESNHKKYYTI